MEAMKWCIIEHADGFCSFIVIAITVGILLAMCGGYRLGLFLITIAGGCFLLWPIVGLLIDVFSGFWTAIIAIIVISSFFTKSGQTFWKYALTFGLAYRISESIFRRK